MAKKVIRLTEADIEKLVQKVLSEQGWEERGTPEEIKMSFNLNDVYPSGQYEIQNTNQLDKVVEKIKSVYEKYGGKVQFNLKVVGGESQVPNPKGFEEKGSLAKRRAQEIKDYLRNKLGQVVKNVVDTEPVIGKTKWEESKGKDHPDYTKEQFIKVDVMSDGKVPKRVFIAPRPMHGINPSGSVRTYGFLDGSHYVLRYKYPEEFKYLKLINQSNDFQDWNKKRHRLYQVCNRYGSLCKSVEYPRGNRKLVDNDETFNELIQKMKDEKLRFPIGAMGKELK